MKTVAVLLVATLTAFASNARAATTPIPIAAARFTPSRTPEGLRWDARYIVDVDAAWEFQGGTLPFAVPLAQNERLVVTSPGVRAMNEGDRIVGLVVDREALQDRTIRASFLTPVSHFARFEMGVPVLASPSVQIIDPPLTTMEWTLPVGFEKHVGYVAPPGIGHSAREEARRLTDTPAKISESLVYVRGDDLLKSQLHATIVEPRERTRSGTIGIACVFVVAVGGLVVAARRLRHTAGVERADQILKDEIDRAEGSGSAS